MNVAPSTRWSDTLYVGPVTPNGAIDIKAIMAIDGVEGNYQPPLSSEWVVFCDPAKRDAVVEAIQKLSTERMSVASRSKTNV